MKKESAGPPVAARGFQAPNDRPGLPRRLRFMAEGRDSEIIEILAGGVRLSGCCPITCKSNVARCLSRNSVLPLNPWWRGRAEAMNANER